MSAVIQGWFAQCRKVTFESAILIRCPDRETALKVMALAKGSATPLNETVLAYNDPGRKRPALIKRLKEMGVTGFARRSTDQAAVSAHAPCIIARGFALDFAARRRYSLTI
jgi:hypothetical protein